MCLDPDVGRVSAEGLKAVVAATEHFLQRLAVQAAQAASAAKRSTIKFSGWCSLVDLTNAELGDSSFAQPPFTVPMHTCVHLTGFQGSMICSCQPGCSLAAGCAA